MKNWSRHIGETHRRRDRTAGLRAQAVVDREHEQNAACLQRWPALVVAMKALVASYNERSGREAVTLVEDTAHPGVTLESATNGRRALVLAVDGSDISVRTRHGRDQPLSGTQWVSLNRTDEDAAAYLLRDWMERL